SGTAANTENVYGLTYEDASRLQTTVPGVTQVVPMRIIRENVRFSGNQASGQVIGTLPSYPQVQGIKIVAGRFLSDMDEKYQRNVCVITTSLASRLFSYQDPLESTIRITDVYYQVVGLVQEMGTFEQRPKKQANEGDPIDNNVYIP